MAIRPRTLENLDVTSGKKFWRGRRVFLTGNTGFKGSWTALWLERAGADITGFAQLPEPGDSLYTSLSPWPRLRSITADIRDAEAVERAMAEANPEIVIHLAAQAILRRSFRDPLATIATNVMGTANLLAASTGRPNLRAILVITSDKVYDNPEDAQSFREGDALGGDDPYSASKVAAEAVIRGWRESFLNRPHAPALGVARAGNVIGGGDWGEDRIVPDLIRAGRDRRPLALRYPRATRPWQHVLDVVSGYLAYAQRLVTDPATAPPVLNFGPPLRESPMTTAELVERLQAALGWRQEWINAAGEQLQEKSRLALDSTLAVRALAWRPKLSIDDAIAWIARWHKAHLAGADMRQVSLAQIAEHETLPLSIAEATGS
ncbi:MAG TPA: CDP-glucose 4,6-dehydratase [Stellaceae bacterium]|nr:CDP-glucose 4,6-dehydratase [Stellaceae bacterium]